MLKIAPLSLVFALSLCTATAVQASSRFIFKDVNGKEQSVSVVDKYYPKKIANYPAAKVDRKMNPQLVQAATIAQDRASSAVYRFHASFDPLFPCIDHEVSDRKPVEQIGNCQLATRVDRPRLSREEIHC